MFTMFKIKASRSSGKDFYLKHLSANDYYSEKESITGKWKGSLAKNFDLEHSPTSPESFSAFQQNLNPATGEKLTQRTKEGSIRFYDFQCSAQKSLSVMSLFDSNLAHVHREAVDYAMKELERLAAVRVRHGANSSTNNFEFTGKIVYAQFNHDSSRSLDPQQHTHNAITNVTWDETNKCYKALETLEICRAIRYCGKVYQNYAAKKILDSGYKIENTYDAKGNIKGFEIVGVPEKILTRYSKRRKEIDLEIENFKKDKGRAPTFAEIASIARLTRDRKMTEITKDEVIAYQKGQLSSDEKTMLENLVKKAAKDKDKFRYVSSDEMKHQIEKTIPNIFERNGVVRKDKIMAEVLNQTLGKAHLNIHLGNFKEIENLRNLGGGDPNPYFTTEKIVEQEYFCVDNIDEQKDIFKAINPNFIAFENRIDHDYKAQQEVVTGVLSSNDRFMLLRGVAGAGKTSTLQELCKGINSNKIPSIHLIAPTNSAVDVLRDEGFAQAQTVARFLHSKSPLPQSGSFLIIDESGLNNLQEGTQLVKLAMENNYRILFVGDSGQHSSVASGDFFRLLETYSKIDKFELLEIHRQKEEYKAGVAECSLGMFEDAFNRFDSIDFIKEGKAEYLENAADSYFEFTDGGKNPKNCIAVAPTHAECEVFTEAIRKRLKASGLLSVSNHAKKMFYTWGWTAAKLKNIESYKVGQQVSFVRSTKGVGSAGEVVTIIKKDDKYLYFDNGKMLYAKKAADCINAGETRKAEFCEGDLVQFSVNLKKQGIHNGSLGVVSKNANEIVLLDKAGRPGRTATLPESFAGWRYGWVTTSHKAQGRTSENVVVAAEKLTKKAFYVSMSRAKQSAALHCPDKEHLKSGLLRHNEDRLLTLDMDSSKSMAAKKQEARKVKAATLPDKEFLTPGSRLSRLRKHVKKLAAKAVRLGKIVFSRTARKNKYPGIVNEKTILPATKHNAMDLLSKSKTNKPTKGMEL